jgi:hypothetical protein
MASLNSPMAEFFPRVNVEVGNELFYYIFKGEPDAVNGSIDLSNDVPGLGLTIQEEALDHFDVIESTGSERKSIPVGVTASARSK